MFTITIANDTIKRYKLQWHDYNGIGHYVKKRTILHGTSLDNVKDRALQLFGTVPDYIQRV